MRFMRVQGYSGVKPDRVLTDYAGFVPAGKVLDLAVFSTEDPGYERSKGSLKPGGKDTFYSPCQEIPIHYFTKGGRFSPYYPNSRSSPLPKALSWI